MEEWVFTGPSILLKSRNSTHIRQIKTQAQSRMLQLQHDQIHRHTAKA